YWRERQFRRRPYYKKTVRDWREKVPSETPPVYSIVLIGDTGAVATDGSDAILNLLQDWLKTAKANSRVIFLGDNIYPVGLPPETHRFFSRSVERLQAQLDIFRNYAGKVTFLSGNHDWNKGRPDGYSYLTRQEAFIRKELTYPEAYLPANGCTG